MEPVHIHELEAGQPLPHAMYTRGGRLMAHSGTVLTPELVEFLSKHSDIDFRFDTRAEPVGVRPMGPRESEDMQEARIDADRAAWERRLLRTRAELRRSAAALVQVSRERWDRLPLTVDVGVDPLIPLEQGGRGASEIPAGEESALKELRELASRILRSTLERLLEGETVDSAAMYDLAEEFMRVLARNSGLYSIPAMGLPRPADSLSAHSVTVGAVALGIAARLGWPRADVRNACIAGFLADAGMGLVPHAVREAGRPLTDIEVNAVHRHPEYGVALLRGVRGLPESVVLGVYQHHERCDGTGYPQGMRGEKIHDVAKVVAVAEVFAGMTAPRAHRPAMTPHAAMSELAHRAAAGEFDRGVVGALVDLLGLYPARSFVRLSSGHIALVGTAARPGASDRPTVHVVQPAGAAERFGRAIDLAMVEPKRLRIVEAVRTPEGIEV